MNNPPVILIVDDEPEIRELYGTKLQRAGFKTVTATNGQEGVEAVKQNHPDLVLMDLKMPVMDGMEAFMKIKEDQDIKDTHVVFLTAFSDTQMIENDVKFAKEMSATDFIKKGESLEDVVAKIKKIFGSATPAA